MYSSVLWHLTGLTCSLNSMLLFLYISVNGKSILPDVWAKKLEVYLMSLCLISHIHSANGSGLPSLFLRSIGLIETVTKIEKENVFYSQVLSWPGQEQTEARSQQLDYAPLLFSAISKKLDQKQRSQNTNWQPYGMLVSQAMAFSAINNTNCSDVTWLWHI